MAELVDPAASSLPTRESSSAARTRVLDALGRSGRDVGELAATAGMAIDAVRAELGLLELDGLAVSGPTGWRRAASG